MATRKPKLSLSRPQSIHKTPREASHSPSESFQESESGDEDDIGVYDLEEEQDDLGDSGDDAALHSHLSKLERQERAVRASLRRQVGEDSASEESEAPADDKSPWGAKRTAYYGTEQETEQEALRQEEEEARALQRQTAEALEHSDFSIDLSEAPAADTEDPVAEGSGASALLQEDAQVLAALLVDLKASISEVRSRILPLIDEVQKGSLATAEGVSYLETKNILLLHYCLNLIFYALLKAEGKTVQNHPVVSRLVEIRAFQEKIQPLDKKLQYQIEKLLTCHHLVQGSGNTDNGGADLRPSPGALVPKVYTTQWPDGGMEPAYRPPKMNPAIMQGELDRDQNRQGAQGSRKQARKSLRSGLIKDLAREVYDMPEEVKDSRSGGEDKTAMKQRARLERRAEEEEELMMRVPLSKRDVKDLKATQRAHQIGGAHLDEFADDIAGLIQTAGQDTGLSQRFGVDAADRATPANGQSGDADLPSKPGLGARRAQWDNVRAKDQLPDLDTRATGLKRSQQDGSSEDEGYTKAEQLARTKRDTKRAKYTAINMPPPLEDAVIASEAHRKISSAVEKNRGLTPHRKRDTKNPRVKGRKKYETAKTRRKGQVLEVQKPTGTYGGEESGIRSRTSKSVRL